jgi:Protein of unknown function (DUF4242)
MTVGASVDIRPQRLWGRGKRRTLLMSRQPAQQGGCERVRLRSRISFLWLKTTERGITMPKFVIERDIPKAGSLSPQQLQEISQKSCKVLRGMSTETQWVHSYVTDDKIYCIYVAPNEDAVREHAQQGDFPANRISRIRSVIDPTTAE